METPRDCSQLEEGTKTGVHDIWLRPGSDQPLRPVKTYCEIEDGTSWTVVQRRADIKPRENFTRDWDDYKDGFGNLTGEFWWGLENIWQLTSDKQYVLRIDFETCVLDPGYAEYKIFEISSEADGYELKVAKYTGNAGDGFSYLNGAKFSTIDNDQDSDPNRHCAASHEGGWWWHKCSDLIDLNGQYQQDCSRKQTGIWFMYFDDGTVQHRLPLQMTQMKIRLVTPRDCSQLEEGTKTGVHDIWLRPGSDQPLRPVKTYCEIEDGTSWTVVQRRADIKPRENFTRDWDDYKDGFGNLTGEFWWGLENIWQLTLDKQYVLRIDFETCVLDPGYAEYKIFEISSEADGYELKVAKYTGNAGDGFSYLNGAKFSTIDNDQDSDPNRHCAASHEGGWWWHNCSDLIDLNGQYQQDCSRKQTGIWFMYFDDGTVQHGLPLQMTQMKIRLV